MASEDSRLNQTAIIMCTLLCFSFQRQRLLIVCVESHDASLFSEAAGVRLYQPAAK